MKKKISTWLKQLPKEYRAKALANFKKQGNTDILINSQSNALINAFTWRKTPEGSEYWGRVFLMSYEQVFYPIKDRVMAEDKTKSKKTPKKTVKKAVKKSTSPKDYRALYRKTLKRFSERNAEYVIAIAKREEQHKEEMLAQKAEFEENFNRMVEVANKQKDQLEAAAEEAKNGLYEKINNLERKLAYSGEERTSLSISCSRILNERDQARSDYNLLMCKVTDLQSRGLWARVFNK